MACSGRCCGRSRPETWDDPKKERSLNELWLLIKTSAPASLLQLTRQQGSCSVPQLGLHLVTVGSSYQQKRYLFQRDYSRRQEAALRDLLLSQT